MMAETAMSGTRTVHWDNLPQDLTLLQLADTAFALGIDLKVYLVPLARCPYLAEAWERKAMREFGKDVR